MKKKLLLDLTLFIIMLLLMFYNLTGALWHEILGIAIFILFIIHNILNYKWLKNVTLNYSKMNKETKLKYIVNIFLWITMILSMISGIYLSNYIFKINTNITLMANLHIYSSYIMFFTILLHLIIHLKMISKYLSIKFHINNKIITLIITSLILLSGFIIIIKLLTKEKQVNNTDNEENINDNQELPNESDPPITLEEFLSKRNCSNCHNHCVLSSIRCGRGESAKAKATTEYNETYLNKKISDGLIYNEEENEILVKF